MAASYPSVSQSKLPGRGVAFWSWRLLGCDPVFAGGLLVIQLWLGLLWFFYQGFGIERGLILCGLLVGLLILPLLPRRLASAGPAGKGSLKSGLRALLLFAVILDICMMTVSSSISLATGKIPMDEGETSWRAAQLLWHGENPYGTGALVDLGAYRSRTAQRESAGLHAGIPAEEVVPALERYRRTLDPTQRRQLLSVGSIHNAAAARESRLYGYKYGPVILMAVWCVAPFGIPGAVLIVNGLVCFALFAVNWRILRRIAGPQLALAGAAMLALLLDRHITRDYIDRSATDVWALLFGSLAVLACLSRKPLATAASVALAVGCKSMPGLLFAPLLLRFRSPIPVLVFGGLTGAIYLPWLLWDGSGLTDNVFLWPFYMATDFTSWEYYAPAWASLVARAAALAALALLWFRHLSGREPRLFWTLATSSTLVLLASGFLRNGYIPWASLWVVAAIVETFAQPKAEPVSQAVVLERATRLPAYQ